MCLSSSENPWRFVDANQVIRAVFRHIFGRLLDKVCLADFRRITKQSRYPGNFFRRLIVLNVYI